ncbi:MAG: hypothetical protein Q9174_006984 [Haloplaca sp. 1 TL-2023]
MSRSSTPRSSASSPLSTEEVHEPWFLASPQAQKAGVDVLAASLPPGSMTGAPKRRSCALLREIENERLRGVYSGVVGYMDVGGAGDFSVVIRSAFRWDVDRKSGSPASGSSDRDTWTVGAGGAVTSLSTEEGEYEEMMAKMSSTLRLFEAARS